MSSKATIRRFPARNLRRFLFLSMSAAFFSLALLGPSQIMAAGPPSVAELVSTCDRAFARGNRGRESAACEWYAAPCACKFRGPDEPRWCVPESESIDATVKRVVAELRRYTDKKAPAGRVVPEILATIYPCP